MVQSSFNIIHTKSIPVRPNIRIQRCNHCFYSHFPFSRFCKKQSTLFPELPQEKKEMLVSFLQKYTFGGNKGICNLLRLESNLKKLSGGASKNGEMLMIKQAIESARKHGISLEPGSQNNADGNCTFESVLLNINNRSCFNTKLEEHPDFYRNKWITEFEITAKMYPTIGAGYSEQDKKIYWNQLKCPGVYNIPYFGDLIINAIAKGSKKNILIFNTSPAAFSPIYVVQGNEFGGKIDSDIPVVLAYNQVHYESLHPVTLADIEKTRKLCNS